MPCSRPTCGWQVIVLGLVLGIGLGALLGAEQSGAAEQGAIRMAAKTPTIYDFTLSDIDGKPVSLSQFKGKVLMLVNTASFCGNTPQYADLEKMYETYKDQGFEILAFPANNFGQQEPGTNEEIKGFCLTKYSVAFPLFSKISVKGSDKHPLYRYLTEQSPFPGEVEWNFQKYLVDRSGNVVARYHHGTKPLAQQVVKDVERFIAVQ
ncbi:MAG: Thiol-disulfide oxidoreductase ResA [Nitrospirae bacterium]|nr:Thiol-disulfide oxidoreductase ResA [Nitrospirota bacterium]